MELIKEKGRKRVAKNKLFILRDAPIMKELYNFDRKVKKLLCTLSLIVNS